ncbi:MAG: histidine kinase [Mycobacteriaceae bacterium]
MAQSATTRLGEHPRLLPLPGWAVDTVLVVVVFLASLPPLFHENAGAVRSWSLWLLLVTVAGLVVRRRYPVAVFAWALVLSAGGALADPRQVALLPVVVALGTVAWLAPRRAALTCACTLELAVLVGAAMAKTDDWWIGATLLSGLVAAALGVGLYTATRRAYLAALHDRAERLERERDQRGVIAAAAERARIAREIHDIVAHHLTVMVALSDGAAAVAVSSPARAVDAMRAVSDTGRQALTDTRRLLGVLRDDRVDVDTGPTGDRAGDPAPGLHDLDVLVGRVRAAGLPVRYEVSGAVSDVPQGQQLTVYRLVQEALTNTLRHAGPGATVVVVVQRVGDELRLRVSDDGTVAGGVASAGPGRGLIGMRERVQAFGGHVSAGPQPGGGWCVSASVRLDDVTALVGPG